MRKNVSEVLIRSLKLWSSLMRPISFVFSRFRIIEERFPATGFPYLSIASGTRFRYVSFIFGRSFLRSIITYSRLSLLICAGLLLSYLPFDFRSRRLLTLHESCILH